MPTDDPRSTTLVEQIASELREKLGFAGRDIEVIATEGNILLRGCAASASDQDRAVAIAWSLPGVKNVSTELRITAQLSR